MNTIIEESDPLNPITYTGNIIASNTSELQTWTILNTDEGEHLFINNQLQSCSSDEVIYHEMFVHSLMIGCKDDANILILGGAEGCVLREVLKWPISSVTQVDWDESLVSYFINNGSHWNNGSYNDPRVTSIISEAYSWLLNCQEKYNYVFIDLLDPSEDVEFFLKILNAVNRILMPNSYLSINVGVIRTCETPACKIAPEIKTIFTNSNFVALKINVPSFKEEWGFLMITPKYWNYKIHENLPMSLKYFTHQKLFDGIKWSSNYPSILTDFWKDEPKKLVANHSPYYLDFEEHYGR